MKSVRSQVSFRGEDVFLKETGKFIGKVWKTLDGKCWQVKHFSEESQIFLFQHQALSYLLKKGSPTPSHLDEVTKPLVFKLRLLSAGGSKIRVIKTIREITGFSLKEAKDVADLYYPDFYKTGSKDDADEKAALLRNAGALVHIEVE